MKEVECPSCHKKTPNYPAGCCWCGHALNMWSALLWQQSQPSKKGSSMESKIFIALHIAACFLGFWLLLITIPLHLLYLKK